MALSNARAQAATMVIAPGDCEGGPDNRHRGSDQWLYVLSGGEQRSSPTRADPRPAVASE